jgi:hydroxyacylglutathione hydrolase
MIQVKQLVLNPFQENTYIVYDQTGEAIIIDAGCYSQSDVDEVKRYTDAKNLRVKYIVTTHGHIDHILGIQSLKDIYKAESISHAYDLPLIESSPTHALMFGLMIEKAPTIDRTVKEGDKIIFGNTTIDVVHTPGHSKGGICLLIRDQNILFSGDTLFRGSIGRTDLMGGSYETLIESIIHKIFPLGDDIVVYPGHGDSTTIEYERNNNPFLLMN